MRLLASATLALMLLSAATATRAHDVWLTLDVARRVIVNYGHPGDRLPPDPDKLVDLTAGGTSLLNPIERIVDAGIPLLAAATAAPGGALVTARYDNGIWVEDAGGRYINATRRAVPSARKSLWSMKFAKLLVPGEGGAPPGFDRPVGHLLELVPLDDPFRRKPGETLRVRLLFRGKPLAGAGIEIGDAVTVVPEAQIPRHRTGRDGVAAIPLGRPGLQLIVIDHAVPGADKAWTEREMFAATLAFVLPP